MNKSPLLYRLSLTKVIATAMAAAWINSVPAASAVYDVESVLMSSHPGVPLAKVSQASISEAVEQLAAKLKSGDVLLLPRTAPLGDVDLTGLAPGVSLRFGREGRLFFGSDVEGLVLDDARLDLHGISKRAGLAKATGNLATLRNARITNLSGVINAQAVNSGIVYNNIGGSKWTVKGDWRNNSMLYVQMLHEYGNGNDYKIYFEDADATNSKIYGIVETDYCAAQASVGFVRTKGLSFGVGDTERPSSVGGLYHIKDSENILMVSHRLFHSHGNTGCGDKLPNGFLVSGGKNNTFLMVEDIQDNLIWSLALDGSRDFRIFGGFFEDAVVKSGDNGNIFQLFYTPKGFGDKPPKSWGGPGDIQTDTILSYKGKALDHQSAMSAASEFDGFSIPRPPRVPELAIVNGVGAAKTGAAAAKVTANWGAKALAAGMDATGLRSSSAALRLLVEMESFVELPPGRFLLTEPLVLPNKDLVLAGTDGTVFFTSGNFPTFQETGAVPLNKAGPLEAPQRRVELLKITLDGGGTQDVGLLKDGFTSTTNRDLVFENFKFAGVFVGNWEERNNPAFIRRGDGFDQVRWINCRFTNTGDYGMYTNREQVDKQLWYNCTFTGQKKAGLSYMRTHMFEASSIVNCTFKNIGGPGVNFGGNTITSLGQGGGPATLMNCLFEECGNDKEAAVEWGWMRQGLVLNNRIVIKTKPWRYGFRGTGQMIERTTVEVDLSKGVPGAAGFAIRHPRMMGNSRTTGNILSHCSSNAPLIFVNDLAEFKSLYGDDLSMPAAYRRYDFSYTHLLDSCSFSGGKQFYDYVMVATDEQAVIKKQIAFSGTSPTVGISKRVTAAVFPHPGILPLHDFRGRRVGRSDQKLKTGHMPYIMRNPSAPQGAVFQPEP